MDSQLDNNGIINTDVPQLIQEFREALEDEIKAIKRKASSSAVSLSNGKRIDSIANQYQYMFTIDDKLNIQDDSPVQFKVPGKTPMEATIISCDDIHIVIGINQDLGDFIAAASLQSDLSILLKKLIDRIESNSKANVNAGLRMLGKASVDGMPQHIDRLRESKLTPDQIDAVESVVGRNLTYIWGPPGTGKTTTIGTIIEELYHRGRSVLLVSYTNIAVDEAILKTASNIDKIDIDKGDIIRLGIPKNIKLSQKYPNVLFENQKANRSQEIQLKLNNKKEQLDILNKDIEKCYNEISEYNWYSNFLSRRKKLKLALQEYESKSTANDWVIKEIKELELNKKKYDEQINAANEYLDMKNTFIKYTDIIKNQPSKKQLINEEIRELDTHLCRNQEEINLCTRRLKIEKELSKYLSMESQKIIVENLQSEINELQSTVYSENSDIIIANECLSKAAKMNGFSRLIRGIPSPQSLNNEIITMNSKLNRLNIELEVKNIEYGKKYGCYMKTYNLKYELSKLTNITMKELEKQRAAILEKIKKNNCILVENNLLFLKVKLKATELEKRMRSIESGFEETPEQIVINYNKLKENISEKIKEHNKLTKIIIDNNKIIDNSITEIKKVYIKNNINMNEMEGFKLINFFEVYYNSLIEKFTDFSIDEHKNNINLLESSVNKLSYEIIELKEKLEEIGRVIISQAKIIGTTLTKAYLSDELHGRKFDTVILDEASMAPIPALWATVLMSSNNVVIVGDFRQLPPIVLSNTEIAKKWIGCDIFEQSGVKEKYLNRCEPENFIILRQQYRMEKNIADVANRYYGGMLESPNSDLRVEKKKEFKKWYKNVLGTDSSVVLIDTRSLNAWVTSVVTGNQASRLNFISAALSVNLAEKMTSKITSSTSESEESKVLIISPYRPHAKLTDKLIKESGIDGIVRAGTVHSFQGSEADIVIFDLVVDEPHYKVNLFMNFEEINEQMRRLFNVSITRGRFKLVIIGNFKYCLYKGKNSELGILLKYLINEKKFPIIDAKELAPKLYEKVLKAQKIVIGGTVEAKEERLVVNQETFYKYFCSDLHNAKKEVIIYSPFITKNRLAYLLPQIQVAIEKKISIYIITKSIKERNKSEIDTYKAIEEQIINVGCILIHKKAMHEKVVFVDNEILWTGSLNPLSFSSTQEIMERRKNKFIVDNYKTILRTSELIGCIGKPEAKCPICGSEMIASEGKDEPYYWRCINDKCFTRGIEQKYPTNGELTCKACDAALEFGYWGEEPCWRCVKNKHHHQKLYKSSIKLPKMLKKISKKELKKLSKYLEVDLCVLKEMKKVNEGIIYEQLKLF